jgi:hypothetical protein
MLLRASRVAGQLAKEAALGGLAWKAGKGMLGFAGKHWKGIGGTALVGASAAPELLAAKRQANVGLSAPWLRASNTGQVPSIPKF